MQTETGGLAIVCSGQGRQQADFLRNSARYPEASALLRACESANILPASATAWIADASLNPPPLFDNELAQPLICLGQLMLWAVIRTTMPKPEIVAGYSLGEVTAAALAECWTPVELIRLAQRRGQAMSATGNGRTMLAVLGLTRDTVAELCKRHTAHLAIVNGARHFVVGLPAAALAVFERDCQAVGADRTVRLPVSVAAHTPWMRTAADVFAECLRQIPPRTPTATLLSGVTGEQIRDTQHLAQTLRDQMVTTLDWAACLETMHARGIRVLLELGPGDSLARMARQAYPNWECRAVADFQDARTVGAWVGRVLSR